MSVSDLVEILPSKNLNLPSEFDAGKLVKENIKLLLHKFNQLELVDVEERQYITKELNKLSSIDLPDGSLAPKLNKLNNAIEKAGFIQTYTCASFVSTVPVNSAELYLILQSKILVAAMYLSGLINYEKIISKAFQQFRTMVDKNEKLILFLPDFKLPLSQLIQELDTLRLKQTKFSLRIMPIKKLLDCYQKKEPVYRPVIRLPPTSHKPSGPIIPRTDVTDDEDTELVEFQQARLSEDECYVEEVERNADQVNIERYYSVKSKLPKDISQSLALQNQTAKAVINNINRRQKKLATSTSYLTQREVSILLEECQSNIDKTEEYTFILLSLAAGRELSDVYTESFELVEVDQNYYLEVNIDLPNHEVDEPLLKWINRSSLKLYFDLPYVIAEGLSTFFILNFKPPPRIDEIKDILTSINKLHRCNITLNRIKNHFEYFLTRKGVDGSEIAFILNKGLSQEPGTYYYSVDSERLVNLYQDYITCLFKEPKFENKSKKFGSQLQVKPATISNLFTEISTRLSQERERQSEGVIDFHNLYVIYSILLLNIATGHRPVRDPYESLSIFDLNAETIFISDKEERTELAARVLVLPELAIEQVELYLTHLKALSNYYKHTTPEISRSIMLTTKISELVDITLFFFIFDDELVPVTPTSLKGYLDSIFPLPLNWHRHFMRTKLRELGFSGPFVDAWMGHIGHAGENFDRYSGLSMDDLRNVAKGINNYMRDKLLIEPLNGMDIY